MEQEHYVEKVVKSQEVGIGRELEIEFLVRWHGDWPPDEKETWEPASSIVNRIYLTCISCGKRRLAQRKGRTTCRGINRSCSEPDDSSAFTKVATAAEERRMAQAASTAAKKRKKGKSRAKDHAAPPKSGGVTRQLQNLQHTRQLQNLQQPTTPTRTPHSAKMKLKMSDQARSAAAVATTPPSTLQQKKRMVPVMGASPELMTGPRKRQHTDTYAPTSGPDAAALVQAHISMSPNIGRGAGTAVSDPPATSSVPVGQPTVDKHSTPKGYRGQGGERLYGPGPDSPKQGRAGSATVTVGPWLHNRTISVWWWAERSHFTGTVAEWDLSDDTARIEYDDGDVHWHNLREFSWSLIGSSPPNSAIIKEPRVLNAGTPGNKARGQTPKKAEQTDASSTHRSVGDRFVGNHLTSATTLAVADAAPAAAKKKAGGVGAGAGNAASGDDNKADGGNELRIGSRVTIEGHGSNGEVAFLGEHAYGKGPRVGIVLDEPVGKNNGTVSGYTYFVCDPRYGLLVVPRKVTIVPPASKPNAQAIDQKVKAARNTSKAAALEAENARLAAEAAGTKAAKLKRLQKGNRTAEAKTTRIAEGEAAAAEAADDDLFACGACPKRFLRRAQLIHHFAVHLREMETANSESAPSPSPSPEPEPELARSSPPPNRKRTLKATAQQRSGDDAHGRPLRSAVGVCLENDETTERLSFRTGAHAAEFLGVSAQRLSAAIECGESVNGHHPSPQGKPRPARPTNAARDAGQKPHGCSECNKCFARADQLTRHRHNAHGVGFEEAIVAAKVVTTNQDPDQACRLCGVDDAWPALLCDGCDAVYHLECLGITAMPIGDWYCDGCGTAHEQNHVAPAPTAPTADADSCSSEVLDGDDSDEDGWVREDGDDTFSPGPRAQDQHRHWSVSDLLPPTIKRAKSAKKSRSTAAASPISKSHGNSSSSATTKRKPKAKATAQDKPMTAMRWQEKLKPVMVFSGTRMVKAPKKFDPGMMGNARQWID